MSAPNEITDDWVTITLDREHAEWLSYEIGPKNWVSGPPTQADVVSKAIDAALTAPRPRRAATTRRARGWMRWIGTNRTHSSLLSPMRCSNLCLSCNGLTLTA